MYIPPKGCIWYTLLDLRSGIPQSRRKSLLLSSVLGRLGRPPTRRRAWIVSGEKLQDSYSETSRPSIDPEVLFRILPDPVSIRDHERKLVEELRMQLAWPGLPEILE